MTQVIRRWTLGKAGTPENIDIAIGRSEIIAKVHRYNDVCEIDLSGVALSGIGGNDDMWLSSLITEVAASRFSSDVMAVRFRFGVGDQIGSLAGEGHGVSWRTGYVLDALPQISSQGKAIPSVHPIHKAAQCIILRLFGRIFYSPMLGLVGSCSISDLALRLYLGLPVEGWVDYRGYIIGGLREPFGIFFVGPGEGPVLNIGLAGLLPCARRTRRASAAAVALVQTLRDLGATSVEFEVDKRNIQSEALAIRRGACPIYRVLVAPLDPEIGGISETGV